MMIQPLGGNIKVYRFLRDPKMVALLSVVVILSFLLVNDRLAEWKEVVFVDGGRHAACRTQASTVAEFLREQGVALGRHDRLNLALDDAVASGTRVELFRIEEKLVEREETLPFATREFEASALPAGRILVVAEGTPGRARLVSKVVVKNGVECASEQLYRAVERPARDRVVFRGTGPARDRLALTVKPAGVDADVPTLYAPPSYLPENTLVAAEGLGRLVVRRPRDGAAPYTVAGRAPAFAGFGEKEVRLSIVR